MALLRLEPSVAHFSAAPPTLRIAVSGRAFGAAALVGVAATCALMMWRFLRDDARGVGRAAARAEQERRKQKVYRQQVDQLEKQAEQAERGRHHGGDDNNDNCVRREPV